VPQGRTDAIRTDPFHHDVMVAAASAPGDPDHGGGCVCHHIFDKTNCDAIPRVTTTTSTCVAINELETAAICE